jgi:hypothetical protein
MSREPYQVWAYVTVCPGEPGMEAKEKRMWSRNDLMGAVRLFENMQSKVGQTLGGVGDTPRTRIDSVEGLFELSWTKIR